MTTLQYQTTRLTRDRLQAYAAEKQMSLNEAIEDLIGGGLTEHESQGKYAHAISHGELRQALQAHFD